MLTELSRLLFKAFYTQIMSIYYRCCIFHCTEVIKQTVFFLFLFALSIYYSYLIFFPFFILFSPSFVPSYWISFTLCASICRIIYLFIYLLTFLAATNALQFPFHMQFYMKVDLSYFPRQPPLETWHIHYPKLQIIFKNWTFAFPNLTVDTIKNNK